MDVPIEKKLEDGMQIEMAKLQDDCVGAIWSLVPSAVLHGGTAIWRCYGGNRFSDDLDIYLRTDKEIVDVRNGLAFALNRYDVKIAKAVTIGNSNVFTMWKGPTEIIL